MKKATLRKTLGLPSAIFYGLGTILGAGIYVLVGRIAGESGMFTPIAFVIAAILATFSALSYAELSSRFPQSAGAALYVHRAFNSVRLSRFAGLLILFSGLISAGALANGFAAYFTVFREMPTRIPATGILLLLSGIAYAGIKLSSQFVTIVTIFETLGLVFIIRVARAGFADLPARLPEMIPDFSGTAWTAIALGTFLAFYAFIGFEDLVNTAEELKDPVRDMPRAIVTIMIISTVLYLLVALVAILGLPLAELQATDRPLALLYENVTGQSPILITIISLFAVMNGVLVQVIMTSRLMYGMANEGRIPKSLAYVHPVTRTPVVATTVSLVIMLAATVLLPLVTLAGITSYIILVLFTLVNAGLFWIKRNKTHDTKKAEYFTVPIRVPVVGLSINLFFIIFQSYQIISGA